MTEKINDGLPQSWIKVPLSDLLVTLESGSRPKGGVKHITHGIPSVGGEHLSKDGGFDFSNIKYVPDKFAANMTRGHIQNGDILVVKDGATTGKTSFIRDSFPYKKAVVNEHVFISRCKENVNPLYVFYYLFSSKGNQLILQDFRGAAQGGISQRFADLVSVPLASYSEQNLIVAEIEKQFSRLDEAVAALKRIKANLKRYKASVFKAAVEGKLTEEWRKEHPNVEPASELLKLILAERKKKWEEDYVNKYVAAHGHAPKNDSWKKKYKESAAPDTSNLPELPKGWAWATVEQLAAKVQHGSSAKTNGKTDGVPVLRMGNIFEGRLKLDDLKYLPQHRAEFPDLLLKKGDLLFNRTNSPELVGKTAVYADLPDSCSFASYLIRVQLNDGIIPRFVRFLRFYSKNLSLTLLSC